MHKYILRIFKYVYIYTLKFFNEDKWTESLFSFEYSSTIVHNWWKKVCIYQDSSLIASLIMSSEYSSFGNDVVAICIKYNSKQKKKLKFIIWRKFTSTCRSGPGKRP